MWVESGTGKVKHTKHILALQYHETILSDNISDYLERVVGIAPEPFRFQFRYKLCWGLLMVYSLADRGPNYNLAFDIDSLVTSGGISTAERDHILMPLKVGDYHSANERAKKAFPL